MDPLSVAASVVGLLAAGGKVTSLLFTVITKCKETPDLVRSIMSEVADISAALGSLQDFVGSRAKAASERGNLIQLDQLLTTLTGCVTTYSDLQFILESLDISEEMGTFNRIKWMRQEDRLNTLVQRLQNHKSSLTLMLTIMQCVSMDEAQSCTQKLCVLITQMLESNEDLAERIRSLERERSIISKARSDIMLGDEASTEWQASPTRESMLESGDTPVKRFAFEDELESSRVYSKAIYQFSQLSITSTALYTTALSVFSKLSLSQVSSISFYALPVYAVDLHNSDLYIFGEEGGALLDPTATPLTTPEGLGCLEGQKLRSPIYTELLREPASLAVTPGRSGLLGRFATPQPAVLVLRPDSPVHVTHVGYNPSTMPMIWRKEMKSQEMKRREEGRRKPVRHEMDRREEGRRKSVRQEMKARKLTIEI